MNPLERLKDDLGGRYPHVTLTLTRPYHVDGVWSLDVEGANSSISVEWTESSGFGLSTIRADSYGEGHDEVFRTLVEAECRLADLLEHDRITAPQTPISLGRLRERRGLTQTELASRLNIAQSTLSAMERRNDVQVSTIRRLVEAIEGSLHVIVSFKDATYLLEGSSVRKAGSVGGIDPVKAVAARAHEQAISSARSEMPLNRYDNVIDWAPRRAAARRLGAQSGPHPDSGLQKYAVER